MAERREAQREYTPVGPCKDSSAASCSYKGLTARVDFQAFSDDGCTETSAFVLASNGVTRNPGLQTSSGPGVFLIVSKFDNCNYTPIMQAFGQSSDVTFTLDGQLSTATLKGTVTVTDWNSPDQSTFPVTLDLTWKGYGQKISTVDITHTRAASWDISTHFSGDSRGAQVSGSISDGTTNFAASPTMSGDLEITSGGMVAIYH